MEIFRTLAGLFGFLGVALGAFGAHGLEQKLLNQGHVDTWETATLYLFVHALALIVLSGLPAAGIRKPLCWAGWSWTLGILIFSGSLYLLSITNISQLGAITPIGGVCFLVGWVALFVAGLKKKEASIEQI